MISQSSLQHKIQYKLNLGPRNLLGGSRPPPPPPEPPHVATGRSRIGRFGGGGHDEDTRSEFRIYTNYIEILIW